MSDPIQRTVRLVPSGREVPVVEISPGEFVPDLPPGPQPLYGFVRMVPDGTGKYMPRVKAMPPHIRLTEDIAEKLGLGPMKSRVFRRLAAAGFITVRQITPTNNQVDLESLFKHLEATRDPEFWTPENRQRLNQAAIEIK